MNNQAYEHSVWYDGTTIHFVIPVEGKFHYLDAYVGVIAGTDTRASFSIKADDETLVGQQQLPDPPKHIHVDISQRQTVTVDVGTWYGTGTRIVLGSAKLLV